MHAPNPSSTECRLPNALPRRAERPWPVCLDPTAASRQHRRVLCPSDFCASRATAGVGLVRADTWTRPRSGPATESLRDVSETLNKALFDFPRSIQLRGRTPPTCDNLQKNTIKFPASGSPFDLVQIPRSASAFLPKTGIGPSPRKVKPMNECARRLLILARLVYLLFRSARNTNKEDSLYSRPLATDPHWYNTPR